MDGSMNTLDRDILDRLEREHRQLERLVGQLKTSAAGFRRADLLDQLTRLFAIHLVAEEQHLRQPISQHLGPDRARAILDEGGVIQQDLEGARQGRRDDSFDSTFERAEVGIAQHIDVEEAVVFPALRGT